jgi:hypothetical protein
MTMQQGGTHTVQQARFVENPACLLALKASCLQSQNSGYVISKIIEISPYDYKEFCGNFLPGYRMVTDNARLMYIDSRGIYHCVLITVSGAIEGILVVSDHSDGIRNAACWEYRDKSAAKPVPH